MRNRITVRDNTNCFTPCRYVCIDGRDLITVSKNNDMRRSEWREAEINWSAVGSVSIEDAVSFTAAMKIAIREAHKLNRKYPAGSKFDYEKYEKQRRRQQRKAVALLPPGKGE